MGMLRFRNTCYENVTCVFDCGLPNSDGGLGINLTRLHLRRGISTRTVSPFLRIFSTEVCLRREEVMSTRSIDLYIGDRIELAAIERLLEIDIPCRDDDEGTCDGPFARVGPIYVTAIRDCTRNFQGIYPSRTWPWRLHLNSLDRIWLFAEVLLAISVASRLIDNGNSGQYLCVIETGEVVFFFDDSRLLIDRTKSELILGNLEPARRGFEFVELATVG